MGDTWLRVPRPGSACSVIAEVAQTHDGSLGTAHAFIEAAAAAGADAIKFQTHIASAEGTREEPWRKRFSPQDETRFDYWRRMEFSPQQWRGLREHADKCGLHFLSSPFSMAAVELLTRVGVSAWKVASGEINNHPLLDAMARTGLPVLLSTGMSPLEEIDAAVERVRGHGVPVAVMQCTSMYPTPPESVGLNLITEFRERYGCSVGLSDHSATIYPGLAAATLGAELLEVHITLSREMFGPDVPASITTAELRQLVEGVRFIEKMRANPGDKDALPESVTSLRDIFMKSVVAARDLEKGTVLSPEDLTSKKPGTGIPARDVHTLIGRRLRRSLERDELLHRDDLEAEDR
jgi:N,N'-diacetyllegionaminate synthase